MDNQRLLLFFALALVVMLLWDAWVAKFGPQPVSPVAIEQTRVLSNDVPQAESSPALPTPDAAPIVSDTLDAMPSDPFAAQQAQVAPEGVAQPPVSRTKTQRVRVITDQLDIEIDTAGGDIRTAFLLQYPVSSSTPDRPYPLMGDKLPQFHVAQSGLLSKESAPDHHAVYQAEKTLYRLVEGQDKLTVPLMWTSADGMRVKKVFTFRRNDFLIDVSHVIVNDSNQTWSGRSYQQIQRMEYDELGKSRLLYTFTGAAISTPEKPYEKISFGDMAEWKPKQNYYTGGWVAILQHYFVTAWIPGAQEVNHFYTEALANARYVVGMTSVEKEIAVGDTETVTTQFFVGPKLQHRLEEIDPNLKLAVDYGWLTFIAQPLFWLLELFHSLVNNWGWSIVLLTLTIKLAFYPLSAASYRSMGNMRRLAPKFKAIREKYGEDRQRMSQGMMELYKKEKVNPLSGCWPILVQIPVFISLYWVLLESVEIRQADFMLWINDLSAKDPYYVLPLLMGASMYVQQKLSANPSLDPLQQKIMNFLPIIFTGFFMLFPSGLVLYWVVNNLLSILQQWYILDKLEKQGKSK